MGHWTKLEGSDLDYLYEQAGMKPVSKATSGRKQPAAKQERAKKTRPRKEFSTNKAEQKRDAEAAAPKRRPRIRGH